MKKSLLLTGVLLLLLLSLNTVNAASCCAACPCDCDGSGDDSLDCGGTDCDDDGDGHEVDDAACACIVGVDCDCDDTDPDIYEGASEVCDGLDNDCNAATADGSDEIAPLCAKQDGVCAGSTQGCVGGAWQVCTNADYFAYSADYEDPEISCDFLDNDCDGTTDAGLCITYYRDNDNDGYGQTADSQCLCAPAGAYTAVNPGDCYDSPTFGVCNLGNEAFPGAVELCNGYDDTCEGVVDEGCDNDLDGWCDQLISTVYCSDKLGNTCPNTKNAWLAGAALKMDCRDDVNAIHPPDIASEQAAGLCDGTDNDCDAVADEGCPMPLPQVRVFDGMGVQVVPLTSVDWCAPTYWHAGLKAWITDCYYSIDGNPIFEMEDTYSLDIVWGVPVNDVGNAVFTINHDTDQTSCECFYPDTCLGVSCWLPPGVQNEISGRCCGDDPDEHYVGGTAGVYACCDNKDVAGIDLGGDECVIRNPAGIVECQDRLVGANEDGSPALCNSVDDDCDGIVDEFCQCDSSKVSCDSDPGCPNFLCLDKNGNPKSCWNVGGDSNPIGATVCCGETTSVPPFPDTPGEYYIRNDCDGSDACCDTANECVLGGACMNYPQGGAELCDFIDNDCDCLVDEDFDGDKDGFSTCAGDCDDGDPQRFPGNPEICDDAKDQDCDGVDVICGTPDEITLANLCRLVYDATYLLMHIAVAITVILMVIGGLKLIGSDDLEDANKAKNMIKNALIGLIVVFALLGTGHMLEPECVSLPGTGYTPPFNFGEPEPLAVTIQQPLDMEFFKPTDIVMYMALISGGSPPYMYVWDFGDETPTEYGTCAAVGLCGGPTHDYGAAGRGRYTVKVVITDSAGRKAWDEVDILVDMMIVEIDWPPDGFIGIRGNAVDFEATVFGGEAPYNYEWKTVDPAAVFSNFEDVPGWAGFPVNTVGDYLVTFTVTDNAGRTSSDSITIQIVDNLPDISTVEFGIDTARSCWKARYLSEDETVFEFDVTMNTNANSLVVDVTVVETGDCWWRTSCCQFFDEETISRSFGFVPSGGTVTFSYENFCLKAKKLEILIDGDKSVEGDEWTFCACCDAEDASDSCPGLLYADPGPVFDYHECVVELGRCSNFDCV